MVEYAAMSTFSDANWDVPPGTGYLTVAGLVVAGAITLAYALRPTGSGQRRKAAGSAHVNHRA